MNTSTAAAPGVLPFGPIDPNVRRRCPALIPMSKNLKGRLAYSPRPGMPCPCVCPYPPFPRPIETHTLDFEAELDFDSNPFCDDVKEARLLDGCRIRIKGELKLRDRKCQHADIADETGDHHLNLGCQTGTFVIFKPIDPNDRSLGFLPVFRGDLNGTVGFDPGLKDGSRCCVENHTRGMMIGRGDGVMGDCEICVTYDGLLDTIDGANLCADTQIGWAMTVDGTVCCPCPDIIEEEREKA